MSWIDIGMEEGLPNMLRQNGSPRAGAYPKFPRINKTNRSDGDLTVMLSH